MKRIFTVSLISLCGLASFSGCLLSHSNHSIVRQTEPLKQVVFETERARATFESQVERRLESNKSSASFGIPFIVGLEKTVTTAENAIRNDVATLLDINGDRVISEYETSLQRQ